MTHWSTGTTASEVTYSVGPGGLGNFGMFTPLQSNVEDELEFGPEVAGTRLFQLPNDETALRHYRCTLNDRLSEFKFQHLTSSTVLALSIEVVQRVYQLENQQGSVGVAKIFERLLPAMCYGCGCLLMPRETSLCGTCERQTIADLMGTVPKDRF